MATYDELRKRMGRDVMEVIELDLDFCSLSYGVAPCTASVPTTGPVKCFNTRKSCQDPTNYSPAAKVYRFSSQKKEPLQPVVGAANPEESVAFDTLQNVTITPTEIVTTSMGKRATITAVFQDETHNDVGIDPYVTGRTYNPSTQGTFWGKLLARNPFYVNRPMRYKVGYIDDDNTFKYQEREYIIDKISGPDAKGRVTVTGKDVLKLVDDKRAVAPVANTGQLQADITVGALSATLIPAGVGDLEYAAAGTVRIGDELMSFTRIADALTFTARSTDGTTVSAHSATDPVQQCLRFTNERVDDITDALLSPYIASSKLDTVGWAAEVDEWLVANLYTTVISEPTGVNELMTELIVQGLFYIWYDEIEKLVKLKAIAPTRETLRDVTDENNILKDSMKVTDKEKDRRSQIWVIYDIIDPTGDLDKVSNYKKAYIQVDTAAEGSDEYGDIRVERIFSRWMTANDAGIAASLAFRRLAKFRDTPKKIEFKLDAQDQDLWTGDELNLTTVSLQDLEGASAPRVVEILSAKQDKAGSVYSYMCEETQFTGLFAFISPNTLTADYSAATTAEKLRYGFICYDSGFFLDGSPAYKIS